jgi:SAM-dependent methyltransferase
METMMTENSAANFYDVIAEKYSWFFFSRENIIERQIDQLKPILEQFKIKSILDCSCGDGLQTIPLVKQGYIVDGGDISTSMLKKAAERAEKENLKINFKQADFRELEETFSQTYDCVLTMGNSIPHLMTDEDISKAVSSIYGRTNPAGIAIIEMRDYDKMLVDKERFLPMRINDIQDGFRYSILYVFDYLPDIIRFNVVYLIENIETGEKFMEQEATDLNPIKRADLISHLKEAGFIRVDYENGLYIAQK